MDQKLICGDALLELRKIPENSIKLIIADPPYNLGKDYDITKDNLNFVNYLDFTRKWLQEAKRILTEDGTIYVFMGMRFISYLYAILEQELEFKFNSWITWHYTQGIGKTKGFSPRHDDILMFTKSDRFVFNLDNIRIPQKYYRSINNMRGANPGNVWEFSHVHYCSRNRENHPTQKPEALYERMILASSNERDIVLDPFVGSGTLLRVCQQLKREGIGIEINPDYVTLAQNRLKKSFDGFDSIDDRIKRVPMNFNDDLLKDYINNHIKWFLINHPQSVEDFKKDLKAKYGKQKDFYSKDLFDR